MTVRRCRPPYVFPSSRKPLLRTNVPLPAMDNVPFILPINIRCNSCFQYIYQGTHLLVYKQEVLVPKDPDFEICRICLKCTNCSAQIRIWSDEENGEYDVMSGATKKRQAAVSKKRNYQVAVSKKRKREAEQGGDALKSFDNTTLGSKREIAALDEMKSMESQHATGNADAMLEDLPAKAAKKILALWDGSNITLDSTTDGLKSVENTTLDSEREIAAPDEMKSMESQHATVSADATLEDWPAKVAKRILALWDGSNITLDSTTDGLKSVENTTVDSEREIAALDEMKSMESQHATVSADATLEDWPAKVAKRILALLDASNITLDSTTDGLKYVENTTLDSKREIAALDEMKSMEATVSADSTLEE